MRWTPENEQILWRTIFETQDIHIDLQKVADAWPGDDKPSPKALAEQLKKCRKASNGTNTITLSLGPKRKADDSNDGTPRKKRSPKKAATPKKGGKKVDVASDEDNSVDEKMTKEEGKD